MNDLVYWLIFWLVILIFFYRNARKQSKTLLTLSDELSGEIRSTYLLNDDCRVESFCPEDFLTQVRASAPRNHLWSAFDISFRLTVIQFCLYSMIIQNGILIGGWPLHQILWAALLVDSSVSIVRSVIRPFKSYAQRLDLGVNPLVTTTDTGSRCLIGLIGSFGVIFTLIMVPQNNIDRLFATISAVEFAAFYFLGLSFKITITNEGILYSQESYLWQNIAWYRWYDHREGVLLGIEPSGFRSAVLMILPATSENRDELDDMLERYLPDKQLADIETDSQITFEASRVTAASA